MAGRMKDARLAFAALALALAGCSPLFIAGAFQTLRLVFELERAIEAGSEVLVHSAVFAEPVAARKNFVQVSGLLVAPEGSRLPGRVTLDARLEDAASGRQTQRITLALAVGADGSFKASKKIKKDIGAGELLMISVEPAGADLAAGTQVTICVDVVAKKGDLRSLPACAEENGGSGGGETLSALQSGFLTPTCALAGCHDAATGAGGLVLASGQAFSNLVGVASTQVPSLNRVQPGDADASYLIKKLRGDSDIQGDRMPRGGPFLTSEEIARFASWINAGAADN